jgi:hypothetical protein
MHSKAASKSAWHVKHASLSNTVESIIPGVLLDARYLLEWNLARDAPKRELIKEPILTVNARAL